MLRPLNFLVIFGLLIVPIFGDVATTLSSPNYSETVGNYHLAANNPFLRGPTVNMVTNNSALIFWRTAEPTNATVQYGLTTELLEVINNSTISTDHRVNLTNLQIDSKYWYKVISNGTESETYFFKTAPADGDQFKLLIFGDNRPDSNEAPIQPSEYIELIEKAIEEEPHIVVHIGDFVYRVDTDHSGNLLAWEHFNNITDRLGHYTPIIGVLGNHDTGSRTGTRRLSYYFDAFEHYDETSTYFSFDYAGVHFTILDSEEYGFEGRITGTQYDWLVDDLTNSNYPMKFVFAHRPMYPLSHLSDSFNRNATEHTRLQQLFEEKNVTLFGSGHDHLYNRLTVNGVTNIISGGAGAPPYGTPWGGDFYHYVRTEVQHDLVNFSAIKLTGELADHYELPYLGPIEIKDRFIANTSTKLNGTIPQIFFSEIPTTKYFSWDGGTNSSILTGLPDPPGEHTLDVYAEDNNGVWSHARFVFTSNNPLWTTTTTTTTITTTTTTTTTTTSTSTTPSTTSETTTTSTSPTGEAMDPVVFAGIVGVASIVIVVLLIIVLKRSGP